MNRRMISGILTGVWLFGSCLAPAASGAAAEAATIRYVSPGGNDSGSCANSSQPCHTIQYAVNQAAAGDEVRLAGGTYAGSVDIPDTLTLRGGYSITDWNVSNKTTNPTRLDYDCPYDDWGSEAGLDINSWLPGHQVSIMDLDIEGCGIRADGELQIERVSITNGYIRIGGGANVPKILSEVTITGGYIQHVSGKNSPATLMNVKITNSPLMGIYNGSGSDMVMTDVEISGCHDAGIVLKNAGAASSITRALIQNNGQGINNSSGSIVTLNMVRILNNAGRGVIDKSIGMVMKHVTILGNHATKDLSEPGFEDYGDGGGYYARSLTSTLDDVIIQGNSADGSGGGIYNQTGGMAISNSAITENQSLAEGGGVSNYSPLTVTNSTFAGNSATLGGGLYNVCDSAAACGQLTMSNSSFSGNSATSAGGGLWNGGTLVSTATLRSTILANSPAGGDCLNTGAAVLTGGYNLIETTSTCNNVATVTGDAKLGSLTGLPAYFPLQAGSPAIDAGDNAYCPATDLLGRPRPIDGDGDGLAICDLGPVEFVPHLAHLYLPLTLR